MSDSSCLSCPHFVKSSIAVFCSGTVLCLLLNYFHNYSLPERPLWKTSLAFCSVCCSGVDPRNRPTTSLTVPVYFCFRASRNEKRRNSPHGQGYSTAPHLLTSEFSSGLESVRKKRRRQAVTINTVAWARLKHPPTPPASSCVHLAHCCSILCGRLYPTYRVANPWRNGPIADLRAAL